MGGKVAKILGAIPVIVLLLLLPGCFVPSPLAPPEVTIPPGKDPLTPVEFKGRVLLPAQSPIDIVQLKAISMVDTSNVASDGAFSLETLVGAQVIIIEDQEGRIVLLAYLFFGESSIGIETASTLDLLDFAIILTSGDLPPANVSATGEIEVSARSTALALILLTPVFVTSDDEAKVRIAQEALTHPRFSQLVDSINQLLASGVPILPEFAQTVYEQAVSIAVDIYQQSGPLQEMNVPLPPDPVHGHNIPWVEDAPPPDIKFVNPTAIYYAVGPYDYDATVPIPAWDVFLLDNRDWVWLQLPIGLEPNTETLWELGKKRVRFVVDKGGGFLDPDRNWSDPVIRKASIFNAGQAIIHVVDLFIPVGVVISMDGIGRLLDYFSEEEIGRIFEADSWMKLFFNVASFILENQERVFYWLWQEVSRIADPSLLSKMHRQWGKLLEKLGKVLKFFSWILKVDKIPFFWDLVAAPLRTQYNIQRVDELTYIPQITTFSVSPNYGEAPLEVNFYCAAIDRDGVIQECQWDFDLQDGLWWETGGTPDARGTSVTHTYTVAGTYIVTLRVLDDDGSWDKRTATISVTSPVLPPTSRLYAGTSSPAAVYKYEGGTSWTCISSGSPLENEYAVLCLVEYNGNLYAGTMSTSDPHNGIGRVYRYEGGTNWSLVGNFLDDQVCALAVYEGALYAGTAWRGMKLYRYEGGTTWTQVVSPVTWSGTRALYVSHSYLLMGDIGWDRIGHWDGVTFHQDQPARTGSCIYDFQDFGNYVYATAYAGRMWRSPDGVSWSLVPEFANYYDGNLWELESYNGLLYMAYASGELRASGVPDRGTLVYTAPDGIISMATDGQYLYFGIGAEAGAYYGSETTGTGKIFRYDGIQVEEISGYLGSGVQVLYVP